MRCITLATSAFLVLAPLASGTLYYVDSDGSGDYEFIQDALDAVSNGDIVELGNGEFRGARNRDLDYGGKSITVRSVSGIPDSCVIDCEDAGRGFNFETGEDATAALEGVKIQNGAADFGGGIRCFDTSPTLTNIVLFNNSCSQRGGGLYCNNSEADVSDCLFLDNTANQGGGMYTQNGIPTITGCVFEGNYGTYGGGLNCDDSSNSLVSYCIFNGNTAENQGGGFCCVHASPTLRNCTFYANTAPLGSGIRFYDTSALVENTIISFGTGGGSVFCGTGAGPTLSCCNVYGNVGGNYIDCILDQANDNFNFELDPLFCNSPDGDFRLQLDSPCLDAPDCGQVGAMSGPCTLPYCLVNSSGTGDFSTIQDALDAGCEVIELTDGTYTGAGNRDIDFDGRSATVKSQSGNPEACIIDCEGMGRGFNFESGEDATAVIQGITIQNGHADSGGGIRCYGGSPTLTDVVFLSCTCDALGAGLYVRNSTAQVSDCLFSGNSGSPGSGMYCQFALPTITGCRFEGNSGTYGGGLNCDDSSDCSVSYCTFTGNTADSGGGLFCVHSSPSIQNCTFYANSATTGSNIRFFDTSAVLENVIISYGTGGGSVACGTGANPTLICCNVYGNVGGNYIDCISGQQGANFNFELDPLFCDAAGGDFRLQLGSPCLDDPDCGLVGAHGPCSVSTCLVNSGGSGDYETIQDAVDADCEVIELADGTYTGLGNRDIDFNGRNTTVRSESGDPEACIIDCQNAGRAFYFESGEDQTAIVQGITIRNGNADWGGGIRCSGASPTLTNIVFQDCTCTERGGGLYINGGAAAVSDCVFAGNSGNQGAGMYCQNALPTITGCLFQGNSGTYGGGLNCDDSSHCLVSYCTFTGNTATNQGGGFCCVHASPTLQNCTFYANTAPAGSNIRFFDTSATLENVIISYGTEGGSVICGGGANPTLTCCNVYGNAGGNYINCIADQQ
ncbi:hypothetical protein ACFL6M_03215, partial [Candidatus Eisenbacteria bacterium]